MRVKNLSVVSKKEEGITNIYNCKCMVITSQGNSVITYDIRTKEELYGVGITEVITDSIKLQEGMPLRIPLRYLTEKLIEECVRYYRKPS